MATTNIEWTRGNDGSRGTTWNPTTGCDRVSDGCTNCYAMAMAKRLKGMGLVKYQRDGDPRTSGAGFGVSVHPDELAAPLRWRKPRRVFVDSMGDLFHDAVPDEFIARVWSVMAATPQHQFQILTKRHGRMRSLLNSATFYARDVMSYVVEEHGLNGCSWPLPNCWVGVSVEDQQRADLRIPALLDTPAAVRFLSCEPLLAGLDLDPWLWLTGASTAGSFYDAAGRFRFGGGIGGQAITSVPSKDLDWVIIGGESGGGARPCDPQWIRDIVTQCHEAGVPAFVKQLGSVWARDTGAGSKGGDPAFWPDDLRIRQFPRTGEETTG